MSLAPPATYFAISSAGKTNGHTVASSIATPDAPHAPPSAIVPNDALVVLPITNLVEFVKKSSACAMLPHSPRLSPSR